MEALLNIVQGLIFSSDPARSPQEPEITLASSTEPESVIVNDTIANPSVPLS